RQRLLEQLDLPAGSDLLLGNGSDELIQILALALARPGAVLMAVEPSFVMFRMIATFVGMRYVGVPLEADFRLNAQRLLEAVEKHRPALTFIAYPNNPTGNLFEREAIERLLAQADGLVVIDEAYHAFAGTSFLPELARHPNMLVMRTLSKLGLAGLRLGMLMGRREWIRELDKLRLPYNINVLSQQVAAYVLGRPEVLEAQTATLRAERGRLAAALAGLPGVTAFPSDANFILFRVGNAEHVFAALKANGVLIKNLSTSHPLLQDCLRVTVGRPDENARFIAALERALAGV
ncbi:MAG: histidinol-phosphate transaminase, partial [Burkholderiales bacterium]|nr:histidinol-phosphate transaminase [Burkholderiales bacterium]